MDEPNNPRRQTIRRLAISVWLAFSVVWAVAILVTDMTGGPLAIWIAATIVPVTYVHRRLDAGTETI
jgi:hypothetical protein